MAYCRLYNDELPKCTDEALIRRSNDGDVGEIILVPGEVKACRYCSMIGVCDQAKTMIKNRRIKNL